MVTIDTLRHDRVGFSGGPLTHTPTLDGLAERGVWCSEARSTAPVTLPAHSSLLTGLLPPTHGVRDNSVNALSTDAVTLAEVTQAAGYQTAAFVSSVVLERSYQLDQGFDLYDDNLWAEDDAPAFMLRNRPANRTVDSVIDWVTNDRDSNRPFAAWVHLFDPHLPHNPDASRAFPLAISEYDAEVSFADQQLGRLFAALEAQGVLQDTLVIVTADHGESLGEHGEKTHGLFVYDATIKVPMVWAHPSLISDVSYDGNISLIDVMPTALGMLGLQSPPGMQGLDLGPALRGDVPAPANPQYMESMLASSGFGTAPLFGIHLGHHKFIEAPEEELYDLASDPGELTNLAPASPMADPENVSLSAALIALRTSAEQAAIDVDERPMDQATLETLYALGYLAPQEQRVSVAGLDPKQAVRTQARLQRARHAMAVGRTKSAQTILASLVEDVPNHIAAINTQSIIARQQKDWDAARAFIVHSLEIDPSQSRALTSLGTIELRAGNLDEAEAATQASLAMVPNHIATMTQLASIDVARGDYPAADAHMQAVIDADPNRPDSHQVRGQIAAQHGDWDAAIVHYTAGLALSPSHYILHNLVGLALAYKGDFDGARTTLDAARQYRPDGWRVDYNLACVEALAGNPDVAVPALQRAVDHGFLRLRHLRGDPDLVTLRQREDFKAVMQRIRDSHAEPAARRTQAGPTLVDGDLDRLPPDLRRALGFAPADADSDSTQ